MYRYLYEEEKKEGSAFILDGRRGVNNMPSNVVGSKSGGGAVCAAPTAPTEHNGVLVVTGHQNDENQQTAMSIQHELQVLRSDLFDMDDANSSIKLIMSKVEQLTRVENSVVARQREEIGWLKIEVERLTKESNMLRDSRDNSRTKYSVYAAGGIDSMPSFGSSIDMGSLAQTDSTDSSGQDGPSSVQESIGKAKVDDLKSTNSFLKNEQSAWRNTAAKSIQTEKAKLIQLEQAKEQLEEEMKVLEGHVKTLINERTKLVQEVEVYGDLSGLASELDQCQQSVTALQSMLDDVVLDKQQVEEKMATESLVRCEMQCEMKSLYEEKIALEKDLIDARRQLDLVHGLKQTNSGSTISTSFYTPNQADARSISTSAHEAELIRLKHEIEVMRAENTSLRTSALHDSEVICHLNDEIRSLVGSRHPEDELLQDITCNNQGRGVSWEQNMVIDDDDEFDLNVVGRSRCNTGGSDTISALHETDNVSLLFGQEEIISGKSNPSSKSSSKSTINKDTSVSTSQSEHDDIRAHAEKLLYWANKAEERSVKSSQGKTPMSPANTIPVQSQQQLNYQTPSRTLSSSSIPRTIGLPPRSQSRVRKAGSDLPPRPPSASTSLSCQEEAYLMIDKENANTWNSSVGAFPTLKRSNATKKNVSLSANDTIINNLNMSQESTVGTIDTFEIGLPHHGECCCNDFAISPFSGEDANTEFYLPKLGLACDCGNGSAVKDRQSFSKNPTALSNILREWQCNFLSSLGIVTAKDFLGAHKQDARGMTRKMKKWRSSKNLEAMRSRECYVALKIWSRTCKITLRSIRRQLEDAASIHEIEGVEGEFKEEDVVIEKPGFLEVKDISFADTHTIASISTLGQLSSAGGCARTSFEMMEI